MKTKELVPGRCYRAKVGSKTTDVYLTDIDTIEKNTYNKRQRTRYNCINLATGRTVVMKSAIKFIRPLTPDEERTALTKHNSKGKLCPPA